MRREILAQGTKTPRSFLSFRHSWIQGLKPCHPGLLFHFLQNSDRLLTIVRQPLTSSYIAWYPAFVFCYSIVVVVQPLSPVQLFVTLWTAARRLPSSSLSPGVCSNSCPLSQWCHPTISSSVVLFSSCLQSFPASGSFQMSQLFAWSGQSTSASSISPSNEYSGLISFRIYWFDLAVQGTLKSLFQHHNSKTSVLRRSVFFMVQFSHQYITTGKTIALTRWTFGGKLMSCLFNMLVFNTCFLEFLLYIHW